MSLASKIKRQEREERLMKNIPKLRLKMGDIFRSMIIPLTLLTFLSIIYGILGSVIRNGNITNANVINNLKFAKSIFSKLIGFIPMFTAISIAATFSPHKTLGAITTLIGWIAFIAIQSAFINFDGSTYSFLGIKGLKNITGDSVINTISIPGLSKEINYVNSNIIIGFMFGYLNALILKKLTKKISSIINATIAFLVITALVSTSLGILHSLLIMSIAKGIENSKSLLTTAKLSKDSLNHFLAVLITSAAYPLQLEGLTENVYSTIVNPYYKIILSIFVLPLLVLIFIINAKKGNRKFTLLLYISATLSSLLLGQYQALLLMLFFTSPFLFLIIGALLPAFGSWIIAYVGVGISATPFESGDLIDFSVNLLKPYFAKNPAYKKAWAVLVVGLSLEVISAVFAHVYIKYTKVCILGKANVVKKIFNYEYITENNYVVFAKYHNNDIKTPIRHQVADEMLHNASKMLVNENNNAIETLTDSAKKMGYTKEISLKLEQNLEEFKIKEEVPEQKINTIQNNLFIDTKEEVVEEQSLSPINLDTEENTFENLDVMEQNLENVGDFTENSQQNLEKNSNNSIFAPTEFEYTTELTPKTDSPLLIEEASLDSQEEKETNEKLEKELIVKNKEEAKQEDNEISKEFSTFVNKETYEKSELINNDDDGDYYGNLSSGLSFDDATQFENLGETSENISFEMVSPQIVKEKIFSFENKIKNFMVLSPLLGEIINETPTSIEVLPSSGKLIMPNDATVEYISENRDKYIIDIYGVKMEVLMNAPTDKIHKQHLHNKIYANQGKKLYKGDFFLDGNKKYYSETKDQMIFTFRILPGNYEVYSIRHANKKLSRWDGIFEISLNKTLDTKSRTAHTIDEEENIEK